MLRGSVDAGILTIEVCDNGPGFPPGFTLNGGSGHGLRNVAERIHGYYGDAARLQWNRDDALTRVCLTIPRRTSAASNDRR